MTKKKPAKKTPRRKNPPEKPDSHQQADGWSILVSGKTRSGKTQFTIKKILKARRVMVFDPEDQYSQLPGFVRVNSKEDLDTAAHKPGPGRVAYVPRFANKEYFDYWSTCVLYWGRWFGPCLAVAEELASYSHAGKASGYWRNLLQRGKKRGVSVIALTQFPGESDTSTIRAADEIICFKMSRAKDRDYMAELFECKPEDIPRKSLEYIRKIDEDDHFTRHVLTPSKYRT